MKLKKAFRGIISLPKTIYFNFRVLPLKQAVMLPIFVAHDVELGKLNKNIIFEHKKITPFCVKIGLGGSEGVISRRGYFSLGKKGKIVFKGNATFGRGISVRADSGYLVFGENFSANKNCFISCSKSICFGDEVLLGFNVSVRDSDGHKVYHKNQEKPNVADVLIGNHVWIASHVDILKGVKIGSDSVVAYRAMVVGDFSENNCLIGGCPAKVIQREISWEK